MAAFILKSSERLFKMFFFRPFRMSSFSSKHKGHFLVPVGICLMILHLMLNALLVSLRCHTCLE